MFFSVSTGANYYQVLLEIVRRSPWWSAPQGRAGNEELRYVLHPVSVSHFTDSVRLRHAQPPTHPRTTAVAGV